MSENFNKTPPKSILKKSSFDKGHHQLSGQRTKEIKFAEMDFIVTHYPPDIYYEPIKIAEFQTPHYDELNPEDLASRMKIAADKLPKVDEDAQFGELECEEFELKRKNHYNEFHAVQLGRKLREEEDEDDEEIEMKSEEFELQRKNHYNEFYALQLARRLLREEEEDDDADEDENEDKYREVGSASTNSEANISII